MFVAQKEFAFNAVTSSWIFSINEKEFNMLSYFEFRCIFHRFFFCIYWKLILFIREFSSIFGALLFGVNCFFKRRFRIIIYTNLNNCVWIINDLKQISNNRRLLELFCPLSLVGSCWICNFIKFQNVR